MAETKQQRFTFDDEEESPERNGRKKEDEVQIHEYAELFPMHDGAPLYELRDDIKEHGLRYPLVMHDGKLLDGRRRLWSCRNLGVEPDFITFEGDDADALAFVISTNLKRRHLGEAERAMIAAKLPKLARGVKKSNSPIGESQAGRAKAMNVSKRAVERADRVTSKGSKKLKDAVKEGDVSLSDAAKLAEKSKKEQDKAVTKVKKKKAKTGYQAALSEDQQDAKEFGDPNQSIESFCRRVMNAFEEWTKLSLQKDNPWLDVNRMGQSKRDLQGFLNGLRCGKAPKPCPECEGKGCNYCRLTGRIPTSYTGVHNWTKPN